MTKQLRILVDMDGILADFLGGLKRDLAADGVRFAPDCVRNFRGLETGLLDPLPPGKKIKDYFFRPGFFKSLDPIDGAYEGLERLMRLGHEIVIATAPCSDESAGEKLWWLREHFPIVDQKKVLIGNPKYMIRGDVLIDDAPHNVSSFVAAAETPVMTTSLRYMYNHLCGDYSFLPTALSTRLQWSEIVGAIDHFHLKKRVAQ